MNPLAFVLTPSPGLAVPAGVTLTGTVAREGAALHLTWRLDAPPGTLETPRLVAHPERRRDLWEGTCFECFLARPDHPGYWEFNLAPTGDWNVYRFTGYRAGMVDEAAFGALPYTVSGQPGACHVSAAIDTARLGLAEAPWRLAIATVLADPAGDLTYWALAHPGPEPDFHHPEAFGISLG